MLTCGIRHSFPEF